MPETESKSDSSDDLDERIDDLEEKIEDLDDRVWDLEQDTAEIGFRFGSMFEDSLGVQLEGTNGEESEELAKIAQEMLPNLVDQAVRYRESEDNEFEPEVQ